MGAFTAQFIVSVVLRVLLMNCSGPRLVLVLGSTSWKRLSLNSGFFEPGALASIVLIFKRSLIAWSIFNWAAVILISIP